MKKIQIFRGAASLCSFLLILTMFGTQVALDYSGTVNSFLGVETTIIEDDSDGAEDTTYYPSGLSSEDRSDIDALNELEAQVVDENIATAEEGSVLLMNENQALPLAEKSKVTLLGVSSVNVHYARNGGDAQFTDPESAFGSVLYTEWTEVEEYADYNALASYVEVMENAYDVNTTLVKAYEASLGTYPGQGVQTNSSGAILDAEAPVEYYTDDLTSTFADYGDAAIIMFTRVGDEDNDLSQSGGVGGISELALQPNEVELLEMVQAYKENGTFGKVIVLINSSNAMELDSLSDYGVDACLWIGSPGTAGITGVVNLLTGAAVPSGHLTDTYAADSLSAPANMNAVDNTGTWENSEEILEYAGYYGNESDYSGEKNFTSYLVEAEGIYIGYKYYETRYEDCILNQGNASSEAGTYASDGAWDYNAEVTYPFGYGLSYTTFEQKLGEVTYNEDTDSYEVEVTVTNTGDTYSGKSVVQVYAQTPYGDYEVENGIEKPSISLAGFAKTSELAPSQSETVKVSVEKYFLAGYDTSEAEGYILSEGNYYLAVGDDSHDALNNILAAKSAHGMTDVLGNAAEGDADKVYSWTQSEMDTKTYAVSRVNEDTAVTNQFEEADLNYWLGDGTVTYLSRGDWEATYPVNYSEVNLTVTEEMMKELAGKYEQPENSPSIDDFTQGADNEISFIMMRDVDFDDEETWNEFLDQFTVDELLSLLNAGTAEIADLGIPAVSQLDDNIGGMSGFTVLDGEGGQYWVCEVLTAASFNTDRFEERGRLIGLEMSFCGANECWYGGGNIHRTQFCGRNQQYYSEDPVLGYFVGCYEAVGMQGVGVAYAPKHFAGNNQETDRESVSTFFTEQGFRETELRTFEGTYVEGGAMSVMGGFNRIGLLYCNYSSALFKNILREEWGFEGHVTTDAVAGGMYKQNWGSSLSAGTDYYCFNAMLSAMSDNPDALEGIGTLIDQGDGYMLQCLREAVKNTIHTWLSSWSINGLSATSKIVSVTPWWEYGLYGLMGVFGIGMLGCFIAFVLFSRKKEAKSYEKTSGR